MVSVPPVTLVSEIPFVPPPEVTLVIVPALSATLLRTSAGPEVALIEPLSVNVPPVVPLIPVPLDVVMESAAGKEIDEPVLVERLTAVAVVVDNDKVPLVKPKLPPLLLLMSIAV